MSGQQGHTRVNFAQVDTAGTRRRIEEALKETASPGKLVGIAEILGVAVEMLPMSHCYSKDPRPCFGPDQVRCMHQIKKGLRYEVVFKKTDGTEGRYPFRITKEPYKGEYGCWLVDVEGYFGNELRWLQDMSVCPYTYGSHVWSEVAYMVFTEESRYLAGCHGYLHCDHGCHEYQCH